MFEHARRPSSPPAAPAAVGIVRRARPAPGRRLLRGLAASLLAGLVVALGGGCFSGARPKTDFGSEGTPLQVKRLPEYFERNYVTRATRPAYWANTRGKMRANSADQAALLEEVGQPDYVRYRFRSSRGDTVEEWAWLEKNRCVQFVRHQTVYDGILSDADRTLIQYGYPDRYLLQNDHLGSRRETYVYTKAFAAHVKYFSFADGRMVLGKETF